MIQETQPKRVENRDLKSYTHIYTVILHSETNESNIETNSIKRDRSRELPELNEIVYKRRETPKKKFIVFYFFGWFL